MTSFVVSYDLKAQKDYEVLWAELGRLGGLRALESFWLLDLDNTAQSLRDHLRSFVDDDDKLMVVEFVGKSSFTKANKGTNAWINTHCQ